jgi:hypothetical protein
VPRDTAASTALAFIPGLINYVYMNFSYQM